MLKILVAALMTQVCFTGGITFYYGELFEGQPLYCGGTYVESTGPWLAVTIEWYEQGLVRCGDTFLITFSDGSTMLAKARDAGYLSSYSLSENGPPIIADLPKYWREGRITENGSMVNLSAVERMLYGKTNGPLGGCPLCEGHSYRIRSKAF